VNVQITPPALLAHDAGLRQGIFAHGGGLDEATLRTLQTLVKEHAEPEKRTEEKDEVRPHAYLVSVRPHCAYRLRHDCALRRARGHADRQRRPSAPALGKTYFWMMATMATTAMVMALYRPIVFLALVAIFSFYFAFRGYRSILRKNQRAEVMDWWPPWSLWQEVLAWSLWGFIRLHANFSPRQRYPSPSVYFGIGISGIDIWRFVRPSSDLNTWWYSHMGGMLGSYIATVSAFSAVNFHFLPVVIRWLWPSAIGIPEFFCGSRITGKDSVVAQTKMPRHRLRKRLAIRPAAYPSRLADREEIMQNSRTGTESAGNGPGVVAWVVLLFVLILLCLLPFLIGGVSLSELGKLSPSSPLFALCIAGFTFVGYTPTLSALL